MDDIRKHMSGKIKNTDDYLEDLH